MPDSPYVRTEAESAKKNLRIQKYQDTCALHILGTLRILLTDNIQLLVLLVFYRGTHPDRIFHQKTVDTRRNMNSYSSLGYLYRFDDSLLAHETGSP